MAEKKNQKTIGEQADVLGKMFDKVISKKYGSKRAPEPLIVSTGIHHLDALLGGGHLSSGPIMISSSPESGKSTYCFQMSGMFHNIYENGIIVYIDIEGSGSSQESTEYKVSRTETFGLSKSSRFRYEPIVLDMKELFGLIDDLIEQKIAIEQKTGREFYVMIVWDSVASTRSSKTDEVVSHNSIIGYKARELSFYLEKALPKLKFNRIFFLCVDQVRAKLQIDGPYAPKEKSVGQFKDMQAASSTFSLLHNTQQWLFLSRRKTITPADGMGIDGWYLDIVTEKNKLAPSQHAVTCIFDMGKGIDKFWSEYTFLAEKTPSEKKIYKEKKLPFPLMVEKYTTQRYRLHVTDPQDSSVDYQSDPFYKREAKQKYKKDEEFRQWFDYAMQISAHYRITQGMFKEDEDLYTPEKKTQSELIESDQLYVNNDVQQEQTEEQTEEQSGEEPINNEETYNSVF